MNKVVQNTKFILNLPSPQKNFDNENDCKDLMG
jgi:hypothetical protein